MEHNTQLISVIIPVYNVAPYIEKCLRSVLTQTYTNMEIIVIDNGSDDGTAELCEQFALSDDRIILLKQTNCGVVEARRAGIEKAVGKYICFVDGDDWVEQDMFQVMLTKIDDVDMVSVGVVWEVKSGDYINRRDNFPVGKYYKEGSLSEIYSKMLYNLEDGTSQSLTTWMCNKMFLTDKVKKIYANVDSSLVIFEDAVFVYHYLLQSNGVVLTDDYLYHYCYNSCSASHRSDDKSIENLNIVYRNFLDMFADLPVEFELMQQTRHWFLEKCYFALNERMGMDHDCRIIRYLLDTRGFDNKKIILYGAGRVGKDIYRQLLALNYEIILWADKRYESCDTDGFCISAPYDILQSTYDFILIAAENRKLIKTMIESLVGIGIDEKKIKIAKITRLF